MKRFDLGKCGEYRFASELFAHGFLPLWPSAEAIPFDLIYMNSKNEAIRVQVKATNQTTQKDGSIHIKMGVSSRRYSSTRYRRYTKNDFDLLVVWAKSYGLWYLIPVEKVSGFTISINPDSTRCKWHPYKEAWHLLE